MENVFQLRMFKDRINFVKKLFPTLRNTHHFCVRKPFLFNYLNCLIILTSHIAQLLLISKFYCFRSDPHISFKYVGHNHLRCPMMGKYLSKRSLIKHTCSWRVNLLHYEQLQTNKQKLLSVYHFNDIIKTDDFDLDNILIDIKSYENVLVYNISYKSLISSKLFWIGFDDRWIY